MNQEDNEQVKDPTISIFKRIIIWTIVLLITFMMIAVVIFQPRFFSFLN